MKTNVIIDSSNRNKSLYSNSNEFVYTCQRSYISPKKISLKAAIIPNSQYIINNNNNILSITYSSTTYSITIPIGSYNSNSLQSALQTSLNNASIPSTTFTVTNNTLTSTYTITSTNSVTYNFSNNASLSKILGFTGNQTGTSITSNNCYQVNSTKYYKINISNIQSNYDTNMNITFNFILFNNVNSNEYLYVYNDLTNLDNINQVDITTQVNISNLHIKVYDENNNLIQLNSDYVLIFEIIE